MENIKKQIYTLPDIRRVTKPLWSAWIIALLGMGCGIVGLTSKNLSTAASSDLVCFGIVGALSLILVLCYYLFGDSRRPYHKKLHQTLDPTWTYYSPATQQQLTVALESQDEKALAAVKKSSQPELILIRYSDKEETVFYSQLLRIVGKKQLEPLTDIYINQLKK